MWTSNRASPRAPHRTPSVHSVASVTSNRPISMTSPVLQRQSRTGYESDQSSEFDNALPPMWQVQRQQSGSAPMLNQKLGNGNVVPITPSALKKHNQIQREAAPRPIDDDATSRSSTLDGNEDGMGYPEKAPKGLALRQSKKDVKPHVPGPLESQLAALMSKLIYIEQEHPTVSVEPEEYQEMKAELKALKDEKKTWTKRHEAIWALRDEDVENNIKIRGYLAKARRELEGMTKLRDEDLLNVQIVRNKLAEKTREIERMQSQGGRTSPSRRPGSVFDGRRGTMDLFQAAKMSALEQRTLELEARNNDLLAQLEKAKSGMNIDELNSMTAHQAWKDTVSGLESKLKAKDAELMRARSGSVSAAPASSGSGMDWYRIEALLEEHGNYREMMGGKMQALRSEKESLQKEVNRKDDECQTLQLKVQTLNRRVSVM